VIDLSSTDVIDLHFFRFFILFSPGELFISIGVVDDEFLFPSNSYVKKAGGGGIASSNID
jgi:hypothetical protein